MKVRESLMLDKNKKYIGYCPNEGDFTPGKLVEGLLEHHVCGKEVTATTYDLVCENCGALLSSHEVERENEIIVYDSYKKIVGLLTSIEIKNIRKKRKWSQRQLAKFLDIGEKDITRYENGAIQTRSIDNMIRLVADDAVFERMCVCLNKKV